MLEVFNCGRRKRFFDLWLENFRQNVLDGDPSVQQLQFYLNVYFAIYARKHKIDVGES